MKALFSKWVEGWKVIVRFLWFQIMFQLLCLPFALIVFVWQITHPELKPPVWIALLFAVTLMPILFYAAAKITGVCTPIRYDD